MTFNTIFTYVYHQHAQIFCHNIHKTSYILENMIIWKQDYTKETIWGHTGEPATSIHEIFLSLPNIRQRTLFLQFPTKQLNPLHASLFDLLPSDTLEDTDICLCSLKHRDKFKHVILCFKYMCDPILFAITHKLWTPYHNFGAFFWYNQEK